MPCSFQGCKLLSRWCPPSQSLWVAFIFGTAPGHRAGWPFCCLDCDLWPHPHSPCIISAVCCGLESIERRNFAAFLSFSSTNQENWAVQHIQRSREYIVNLTHRWSSQRGSRRAGLAKNIWTREPRTQISRRCCFFSPSFLITLPAKWKMKEKQMILFFFFFIASHIKGIKYLCWTWRPNRVVVSSEKRSKIRWGLQLTYFCQQITDYLLDDRWLISRLVTNNLNLYSCAV